MDREMLEADDYGDLTAALTAWCDRDGELSVGVRLALRVGMITALLGEPPRAYDTTQFDTAFVWRGATGQPIVTLSTERRAPLRIVRSAAEADAAPLFAVLAWAQRHGIAVEQSG